MKFLSPRLIAAIAASSAISSFAAMPQSGLWNVQSELNGKIGRGIHIERQGGETVIASYFGYRADGSSLFYQTVGKVKDGIFSADFVEYKNGPTLGGATKNGEVSKVLGPVTIEFGTNASGNITLPGEEKKAFVLFTFEDHRKRLNNTFTLKSIQIGTDRAPIEGIISFQAGENTLTAKLNSVDQNICTYQGGLSQSGGFFNSAGRWFCSTDIGTTQPQFHRFENLNVDESGTLNGTLYTGIGPDFKWPTVIRMVGLCVNAKLVNGTTICDEDNP